MDETLLTYGFREYREGLLECIFPSNIHSCNQQMDVVGAFVSDYGFEVHHVSHDGILVHDSHGAKHLAGFTSDCDGHIDVVAFGH